MRHNFSLHTITDAIHLLFMMFLFFPLAPSTVQAVGETSSENANLRASNLKTLFLTPNGSVQIKKEVLSAIIEPHQKVRSKWNHLTHKKEIERFFAAGKDSIFAWFREVQNILFLSESTKEEKSQIADLVRSALDEDERTFVFASANENNENYAKLLIDNMDTLMTARYDKACREQDYLTAHQIAQKLDNFFLLIRQWFLRRLNRRAGFEPSRNPGTDWSSLHYAMEELHEFFVDTMPLDNVSSMRDSFNKLIKLIPGIRFKERVLKRLGSVTIGSQLLDELWGPLVIDFKRAEDDGDIVRQGLINESVAILLRLVQEWKRLSFFSKAALLPGDGTQDDCSICMGLSDSIDKPVLGLVQPCQHSFCEVCINSWLREGTATCPMCRGPVEFTHDDTHVKNWLLTLLDN
jgi:hypothetical protein